MDLQVLTILFCFFILWYFLKTLSNTPDALHKTLRNINVIGRITQLPFKLHFVDKSSAQNDCLSGSMFLKKLCFMDFIFAFL